MNEDREQEHPAQTDPARRRYQLLAPIYERTSGERTVYAAARARAIELLQLRPGAVVLDVACGTGMNFELVEQRIGPSGRLVGIDRSGRMLDRARSRVARYDWGNVSLIEADVERLSPDDLQQLGLSTPNAQFDAALCTLGLSVIPDWKSAWQAMLGLVRPAGRVAVMDGGYPSQPGAAGEVVPLRPLVWLMCRMYAADARRQPWELVKRDADDVTVERFSYGYVGVAAGTPKLRSAASTGSRPDPRQGGQS
jgi:ubiquinone/menaquinone biosynthesis C-methylase UbiE